MRGGARSFNVGIAWYRARVHAATCTRARILSGAQPVARVRRDNCIHVLSFWKEERERFDYPREALR